MLLTLASSSTYRASILKKICIPFTCQSPDIDESPLLGEGIHQQVARLAFLKAQAVASTQTSGFIIGSDQLAICEQTTLGKPGNYLNAFNQLTQLSGKRVEFHTGLCLFNSENNEHQTIVECFTVEFKQLSSQQIQRYLEIEQPYNCAGSFKSEGLGIALFTKLEGKDPNTLIGLPLISLIDLFANWQIDLFEFMQIPQ